MDVVLISALPGDTVPGHELADPDCPAIPGLLDRPQVADFLARHHYGQDPDELVYLVTGEEAAIPSGFPALRVTA